MTRQQEPEFLTREIVDAIHEEQIDTFGGLHGLREVAAAYGDHLAESQAYFDGNNSTATRGPAFKRYWSSWKGAASIQAGCLNGRRTS